MSGLSKDDIIRMAREAGAHCHHGDFNMGHSYEFQPDQMERFATLVAAAEREACAKVAYEVTSYEGIADAIRARGSNG